jgi:uncharacterized protein
MQHMTLKAAVATTTDRGIFEAVISTDAVDRENDIVEPAAMVEALNAWTFTGKMVPLHWNHSSEPEDIVGHVNPTSVKAVNGEVHATGWIDQSTDRGQHVWRLAKSGTIGFSFGYMVVNSSDRKGGGKHITKLDVFEVSATPAPMNPDTRVLSTKAVEEDEDPDRVPTHAELERELLREGLIAAPITAAAYQRADSTRSGTGTNGNSATKSLDQIRTEIRDDMLWRLTATETKAVPNHKSTEPVKVASFEC